MDKIEILQIGNPILRKKSVDIKDFQSEQLQEIIQYLTETMRSEGLVGFATPQIGENINLFVTEIREIPTRKPEDVDQLRVFINPQIVWQSEEQVEMYEGCGSVAYGKIFAPIERPEKIKIVAYGIDGEEFTWEANGLLARVIQHEYDHLEGILFTDKITDNKRILCYEEYIKQIVNKQK